MCSESYSFFSRHQRLGQLSYFRNVSFAHVDICVPELAYYDWNLSKVPWFHWPCIGEDFGDKPVYNCNAVKDEHRKCDVMGNHTKE